MRTHEKIRSAAAVALIASASFLGAAPAAAQLAHASASSLGLSDNNTATVRAFGAISVNPAGLAMPGSGFSLAIAPVRARAGLGPVTLGDLADYQGIVVPDVTKEQWLSAIEQAGGQSGAVGAEVSELALTIGNVGVQLSSIASSDLTLPPGAAEAVLFGNAGRTGAPEDLDLTGFGVNAFAMSTAAVSVGFGVGAAKVGVTGKYSQGHALALARAESGSISTNPLEITLDAPSVAPCNDEALAQCTQDYANAGSGLGLDLGFMMDLPALSVGASLINAFNTFAWDETRLGFVPGTAMIERGSSDSDFDQTTYDSAPADLKAEVEGFTPKPELRLGAALDLPMGLTVTGDIHHRIGEGGMAFGPQSHVGVGAEFRGLKILHLRAGTAVITGGTQYSGGASLVLGPVNISGAVATQRGDTLNEALLAQFTLSFGNR